MITHTTTPQYINDFIIVCLQSIYKKKQTFNIKINRSFYDPKLGTLRFRKKNKKDKYINIHLVNCCYGYDFFNNDILNTKNTEECCVCFEETHNTIQCGHRLCTECVGNIMRHNKEMICPLCRKKHENTNGLIIKYPLHLTTLLFSQT